MMGRLEKGLPRQSFSPAVSAPGHPPDAALMPTYPCAPSG